MSSSMPLTPSHSEVSDLAWIEALGALDPYDRARLAAHLREGCPQCLDALRGGREVVLSLAHLFSPAAPSHRLRARVGDPRALRGARAREAGARAPRRARLASTAAWIALAASFAFAALIWREGAQTRAELAEARGAEARAQAELARSEVARAASERERERLAAAVAAPGARVVELASDGGARGRAFVEGGALLLLAHGLPQLPADQSYQLWSIESGAPRSAGVFASDARGEAQHRASLAPAPPADALLAVTVEPAGGVPQPTGPIVLVAQR